MLFPVKAGVLIIAFLAAAEALAQNPQVPAGKPINEGYRKEFGVCDSSNTFNGVHFPIYGPTGKTKWYPCERDGSKFSRSETIAAKGTAPRATIVVSKLGHDQDGSERVCKGARGPTDQCETSLMLDPTSQTLWVIETKTGKRCVPVNADRIPYVVIPAAAPPGIDGTRFKALSGVAIGDYGVVIANGKIVSVVVADSGPAYKMGEGSTALLQKLSEDGKAHTISANVTYIMFPNTHDPRNSLSPDSFEALVGKKGCEYYAKLIGAQSVSCSN
jgi:hypothetical protein